MSKPQSDKPSLTTGFLGCSVRERFPQAAGDVGDDGAERNARKGHRRWLGVAMLRARPAASLRRGEERATVQLKA